ncbi:MAG: Ig-like domain-containing protein [Gammaproteobacteria bacterium]|nr:Ig-like domain-containing protein [Gammaproteobacteria bacterium]
MAQTIESVSITSTPTGGAAATPNTVYIIGDTITFTIDYTADLTRDPGSPTLRFAIGTQTRTAACAQHATNAERLLCSYVVKEGDNGTGIGVGTGNELVGGDVPDRSPTTGITGDSTRVDGLRLEPTAIAVQKDGAAVTDGFGAGSTIDLALTFAESVSGTAETGMSNTGTMGAALVLENAERAARYISTTVVGVVSFDYAVVAGDHGAFGLKLTGVNALEDTHGNVGLATGWETTLANLVAARPAAERRVDTRGPVVTQILFRGHAAAGATVTRATTDLASPSEPVMDGFVVFDVFFNEPIVTTDTTLRVTVGQTTVSTSTCLTADGSEWLRCTLEITANSGWLDTDGLSTPANPLNYSSLEDDLDNAAAPAFASQRFPDIKVDAVPPTITSATISVPKAEVGSNVVVRVTFSEDVEVTATATQPSVNILIDEAAATPPTATYASVSGKVVEFRRPLVSGDFPVRTSAKTSIRFKIGTVDVAGIADAAGNVPNADASETAAAKTGTAVSLKTVPTGGTEGDQYADKTAPRLERISLTSSQKVYGRRTDAANTLETIGFMVLFSEPVTVDADARLALKIGQTDFPEELTAVGGAPAARYTASYELTGSETGTISVSGISLPGDGDTILDGGEVTGTFSSTTEITTLPACNAVTKRADSNVHDYTCQGRGWINDPDHPSVTGRSRTAKVTGSLTGSARVDTTRPKVKSVTLLTNPGPGAVGADRQKYYGAGETVRILVTMDEDVSVGVTKPALTMSVGAVPTAPTAEFGLLRGKRDLIFEYKVVAGDDCTPSTTVASNSCHIALNGIGVTGFAGDHSSIRDVAGNTCDGATADGTCGYSTWPAAPSGDHGVDARLSGEQELTPLEETTAPGQQTVNPVGTPVVRSSTPTGGYYKTGDTITIEVPLSPPVTFTSAPQLLLNFDEGGSQRLTANERISSTGTPTPRLTFSYTVQNGDEAQDGFTASLSGGGTLSVESGQQVTLGSITVSGIRVDALAPELESLEITSNAGTDGTYVMGENIEITAEFSEDVGRQDFAADPSVPILVGDATRTATLQSPSSTAGGDTWVFRYTVAAGDNDADGVSIAANAFVGDLEDAAGNEATITHAAVDASTSHMVDTTPPTVASISLGDPKIYLESETITATVTFSEPVDVTTSGSDAARLDLTIGSETRTATYDGGDGTDALTFTYTVAAGDTGAVSAAAGALMGNIADIGGNEAGASALTVFAGHEVDAVAPSIESLAITSTPANAGTYIFGETIEFSAEFNEAVQVPDAAVGRLALFIEVGDKRRKALYTSGTGTDTLRFTYEVRGEEDSDGVSVEANQIVGGEVTDLNGLVASLAHAALADNAAHKVDGIEARVGERPMVTSDPGDDGTYITGDLIEVTVNFGETVEVSGTPRLALQIGTEERHATYTGGSGTSQLTFSYMVQAGDMDADGISLNRDSLTLSGGSIRDANGLDVSLTHPGVPAQAGHKVDGVAAMIAGAMVSSVPASNDTYITDEVIAVTVMFGEMVNVTGTPQLALQIGDMDRQADCMAGDDGESLVCSYTVQAGDMDDDGISAMANALSLNGGSIQDVNGLDVSLVHPAVPAQAAHMVDAVAAVIVGAAPASDPGEDETYITGDMIEVAVMFSKPVMATGSPTLTLTVGDQPRTAMLTGGSENMLVFAYMVQAGDLDENGVSAAANSLELNDGTIADVNGLGAMLTHPAVPDLPGHKVDAVAAAIAAAAPLSDPGEDNTYMVGDVIAVGITFSKPVHVAGTPMLMLTVGDQRRTATYVKGSGTAMLEFMYTVQAGDRDENGISADANSLQLDGATIADGNGLAASVAHPAVPDLPGHMVDGVAPMVSGAAISSTPASGDAYDEGETIVVTVTFDEDVSVTGSPLLEIVVGENMRSATCAQGMDMATLDCSYEVMADDFDSNGVSVEANALAGGTITDVPGNAASVAHEALADNPAHKVYAAMPEVVGGIASLSMAAGGATNSLDLAGIFTGFELAYSATSSDTNVVVATVSGSELTVRSGMEGTATVTVTASNPAGDVSTSFAVVVATDPVEKAVLNDALAAIGRSMLSSTASVIGSRFELASTGSSQMAFAGSRFGGSMSPQMQRLLSGNDPFAMQERMDERALFDGSAARAQMGGYGLTADRLLSGTSFNMPLNAVGTGDARFAIWGAGDLASFEGEPDDGMYDGSSSSGYIGVDARGDGWLAGVSVSRSGAEADYGFDNVARTGVSGGGTLETSVTAFHPYARLEVGADSEVWVIGGFGSGEADLSRTHVMGTQSSDLSMAMAVGGLRRALAMEFGGADLSLRGDAGFLSLETDSGMMAVDGLSASVSRLRLGLEASWEGESATPFVEVSGRFDGGDGQTGGGLELAGGLRILNAESGFGLEAKGRVLAMHTGEGYSESGIGVTASFEPGAGGRGITFRLSPRWGGSADATDLFWNESGGVRDASQYAYGLHRAQTWGLDAALGYGFGLRSMPGIVTPFGQMDVTGDQDQRIRVGVRYGLMQGLLGGTQVELSAERVDGEMYRTGETRVLVSGRARF